MALSSTNATGGPIAPTAVRRWSQWLRPESSRLQLDNLDGAERDRREPAEIPRVARQHDVPSPGRTGHHSGVDHVGGLGPSHKLPRRLGETLLQRLHEAGLHHLGQASLAWTTPGLGQDRGGDDRDHFPLGSLLEEGPEGPVVPVCGDHGTGVQGQPRHFDLTPRSSPSVIGPCSVSQSSRTLRPSSSLSRCSTAPATNAERLWPLASAASRARSASAGSNDRDTFSTVTSRSYHGRQGGSVSGSLHAFPQVTRSIGVSAPFRVRFPSASAAGNRTLLWNDVPNPTRPCGPRYDRTVC